MNNLAKENKVIAFPVSQSTSNSKGDVVADLEDGYTRIANAIVDALCKTKLSDQEHRVLFSIVRKTYGYNKPIDWICLEQLSDMTGIKKPNISKTIKSLLARHIIHKDGTKLGVNKVISEWMGKVRIIQIDNENKLSKQITSVIQIDNGIIQTDNQRYPNEQPQKKDNITKDNIQKTYVQNVRSSLPSASGSVFINLPLKYGKPYSVTADEIDYYKALYPKVDIEQSLRSMVGWLDANPEKQKTKIEIKSYIANWLNKNSNDISSHEKEASSNQAPDFHKCDSSWADDLGWEL